MQIPRDPATVLEAVNTGTSLSTIGARSEVALAIDNLSREVGRRCGLKDQSIPNPKRGISRVKKMILGGRYGAP
jgi:Flp pilus assembly CpaE family ATPase